MVTPVDYKHGRPIETDGGLDLWPTDRVQLGVQGLILRENGYRCEEGVGYYAKTKQRVRVVFDDDFMRWTEEAITHAWEVGNVQLTTQAVQTLCEAGWIHPAAGFNRPLAAE